MDSYLTFKIADEVFAVHVSHVMEIREYETPKPVPRKMDFVTGLIQFRDEVIPLIDTGQKFNLGAVQVEDSTVIIVLDLNKPDEDDSYRVGILVDAVSDVLEIPSDQMKPIRHEYKPGYVAGTFNHKNAFVLVLDTDKVFTDEDVIEMDKLLSAAGESNK
ncbi:MAG: chemotaxis protein CheW [Marinilabiliaceae bacterium]